MESTIQNIIDAKDLRWIFVGGKGGVGKTTCSCSIAILLSKVRERVLLLSTDPAHNLSDAFDQKFSKSPTKVNGFDNLFAMEIDPNLNLNDLEEDLVGSEEASSSAHIRRTITQLMVSFPGIDEYMAYTEVFRLVRSMDYSVVVFDTAPTGHTLRLLAFPEMVEGSMNKVMAMKNQFAPFINQFMGIIGMDKEQTGDLSEALENRLPIVREITRQFKNAEQTTFVCVCIPEFLSMYETERLIQELGSQGIDVHNVIVNQLLFPNLPELNTAQLSLPTDCSMCLSRHKTQSKYLEQIIELYDDMHVVQLPQLEHEVRGVQSVQSFANYLLKPFRR